MTSHQVNSIRYRGYRISVVKRVNGWSFHASPVTPDLPILPQAFSPMFHDRGQALDAALGRVDEILTRTGITGGPQ
jgi:hypothetical protein